MDFNVIDYLAYHADVAVPAIILMVIVSAIYLIFYGIRPIKTRFFILFLLSIVSLIIFVVDNPLYYYLGSPYSGLLFVFYYLMVFSVFYVPFSLIAFIKSLLHLIRFQTKYSILLVINSFFATLLAFINLLFLQGSLEFIPNSSMYLIFLLLAIIGIVQNIIGGKENEKNKDYIAKSGKDSVR
ncbi:hypothetical protein [Streptococcus raffinosi]|uniref:Histidine kinase n=1 Tax=Streptococcus raffinosi TaxID=3053355 RepID=A0ABT7LT22_9STRE|nr:hypothetical protein [Streptococcus sp. VTCC 12812]MDL5043770.1 hypothetical protein [Streptococcus sp. VTCC 12812]